MNNRNRYLFKNTVIFAVGSLGTKLINFFLVPLYTNILTPSEYGTADLIYSIVSVLVSLLTLNICESVMRYSLDKQADHNKIMSTGYMCLLVCIVVGCCAIPILRRSDGLNAYAEYIYIYMVAFAFSQLFLFYLQGKELLLHFSIANIIQTAVVATLNILFLVFFHCGVKGYLSAYIIANFITALYAFWAGKAHRVFLHFKLDKALTISMVKYSIILIPNAFMWWIVDSSDRIMISSMVGYAENGLYAIANKFPALLYTVAGIFNQAWSYSAIKEEESTDKDSYSNNVYDKLVSFVVLAAAGLMVIIKPLLSIYVGSDFYHAWIFTPFLIIGVVFMSLGTFASSAYTVHRDSVGFLKSASVGAGVNLALNFLLIPLLGVQGAAIATCISYVFVYLFRVFDTRKYTKLKILRIDHLVGYVFLLIMAGTMLVNSPYSQGFLVMEMMLLVVCYKKYIMQYIEFIKSNLIKR